MQTDTLGDMSVPHTTLLALAVPGIPTPTRGDNPAALMTGPIGHLTWPDGHQGLALGDIVIIDEAFVSICEGNLVRQGTSGAKPSGIHPHLWVGPLSDPGQTAREIRRGLDARFGGRPGVLICPAGSAGIDSHVAEVDMRESLRSTARVLMAAYPGHPVVVIRGLGQFLTYEDQDS